MGLVAMLCQSINTILTIVSLAFIPMLFVWLGYCSVCRSLLQKHEELEKGFKKNVRECQNEVAEGLRLNLSTENWNFSEMFDEMSRIKTPLADHGLNRLLSGFAIWKGTGFDFWPFLTRIFLYGIALILSAVVGFAVFGIFMKI
eukprot:TRINITY_DN229192_c0_g1_i4.p1 TRINITY_DN229192_c0_g1~~TRINITY_DN229192_c0_g1_i4.p1  ORF type:complete len:144 (-),score=26.03 TRINITY_DN229192_c0_g1_i4:93-524(-)